MSLCCITCGQPTRRRLPIGAACYPCAGVYARVDGLAIGGAR